MATSALHTPTGAVLAPTAPSTPGASSLGVAAGLPSIWTRRAALLIVAMTALRLFVGATTGLSDTETYYLSWSRFPSLSYYDHPPLVAALAWLTTRMGASAIAVRIGPILCAAVFAALVHRLASRLFSMRAAFFAVAIVTALPAFVFTSFLLNPEAPLAPLWVLALLLVDDLRSRDEPWRPVALGAVVGVAFLAKYTALLLVPVVLAYVAVTPEARRWMRRPSLYLGGLVALAVATPVVAWNAAHHWPSIALHLVERMGATASLGTRALHVAIGQAVLFHPLIFPGLVVTAVVTVCRARNDSRYRLLAVASIPTLLFLYAVMVRASDAEPHWTAVGYVPLAIAAGSLVDETLDRPPRAFVIYLRASFGFSIALCALYVVHTQTPALLAFVPPTAYDADADPINETLAWEDVTRAIDAEASALGPDTVVASSHNVLCGHLLSALDDRPLVYCPSPRRTEFDFIARRDPPATATVIYVDSRRYHEDLAAMLPGRSCEVVRRVDVVRGGRVLNYFRISACAPLKSATP